MELSLFLAKLIGLYLLIVGLLCLVRRDQFKSIVQSYASSKGLIVLSGALSLVGGIAILLGHPIWELSWRGVVTLMGILAVAQGIMRIGYTNELARKLSSIESKKTWFNIWVSVVVVTIVLGCYLTYMGFNPSY